VATEVQLDLIAVDPSILLPSENSEPSPRVIPFGMPRSYFRRFEAAVTCSKTEAQLHRSERIPDEIH
jgi:hypothetical protein